MKTSVFFLFLFLAYAVSGQKATVISDKANLRGTPIETGKIVSKVPLDERVYIIKQLDKWYLVQAKEYVGWIQGDMIKLDQNISTGGNPYSLPANPNMSRILYTTSVTVSGTVTIEPSTNNMTGKVDKPKRIVPGGYVRFRSATSQEYSVKADEKGKYSIDLPPGTYTVYATVDDKCWMCAEFMKKDFVLGTKAKVKLDIYLVFVGEG